MKCVDLFSGGGGLSIGFQRAGFSTTGYEHDPEIAAVAQRNQLPTICQDLAANPTVLDADVIVGGPPCQPFSEASKMKKQREYEHDKRNGVDVFVQIVLHKRPRAFFLEQSPNLVRNRLPYWQTLLPKLQEHYAIEDRVVNMTHFHVPQKRKRYICIGFRKDTNVAPEGVLDPASSITPIRTILPRIDKGMGPFLQEKTLRRIMKYEQRTGKHARTLRPSETARTVTITNTFSKPGSNDCMRFAFDRDGNVMDRKILIADNLTYAQRKVTFEETCRLQTFPSTYRWCGAREKVQYTIVGNAVPPAFATLVANRMAKKMEIV